MLYLCNRKSTLQSLRSALATLRSAKNFQFSTFNSTSMQQLTYSLAPYNWAICFQDDCPMKDTCLRYAIARLVPADIHHHNTVLPSARQGDHCSLFATKEPVQMAHGMKALIPRAAHGELSQLREGLYAIFGSTSQYYRYRRGEWPITPEQQRRVAQLFMKHGIKRPPHFDSITDEYYFPDE